MAPIDGADGSEVAEERVVIVEIDVERVQGAVCGTAAHAAARLRAITAPFEEIFGAENWISYHTMRSYEYGRT